MLLTCQHVIPNVLCFQTLSESLSSVPRFPAFYCLFFDFSTNSKVPLLQPDDCSCCPVHAGELVVQHLQHSDYIDLGL